MSRNENQLAAAGYLLKIDDSCELVYPAWNVVISDPQSREVLMSRLDSIPRHTPAISP